MGVERERGVIGHIPVTEGTKDHDLPHIVLETLPSVNRIIINRRNRPRILEEINMSNAAAGGDEVVEVDGEALSTVP